MLYSHDETPAVIDAPDTVTTPEVAVIVTGSRAIAEPPGHVVIMLEFVSTTSPAGKVSTNPRPLLAALPGLFVKVKISVDICPLATVVGKNFLLIVGITVYSPSITPGAPAAMVLNFETSDVTAVVASVVVLFASVSVFPVVTTDFVTAAVETSPKRTA